jgi:hypothetical protein
MASASRSSAAYDRRTNGASDPDRQRGHIGSSKQDMPDSKPSPQTYAYHQSQSTSHKRSASGNPRPMSRSNDDRRLDERRTEIRTVTHRETLVARSRTPEKYDRRAPDRERPRHPDPAKPRAPEARLKEPKMEEPQGKPCHLPLCVKPSANRDYSSMEPRGHPSPSHYGTAGLSYFSTPSSITGACVTPASTPQRAITRRTRGSHRRRSPLCLHGL